MESNDFGIYVHIPFCLRKCHYCDFCSFSDWKPEDKSRYVSAIIEEIQGFSKAEFCGNGVSIFFGGGTPSLLSPPEALRILHALRDKFPFVQDPEITLEANPASAGEEQLSAFRQMGFNRLSIGVQSFSDPELHTLGRLHTAEEAVAFFHAGRRAGFSNINLDLMYALPGQTKKSLADTLKTAIALSPEHISAYGLILEENTAFYREREKIQWISEDEEADFYDFLRETLTAAGYRQYEISNYAKPGRECLHNMGYWQSRPYYGFGVSAYSLYPHSREGNTRDFRQYLADPVHAVADCEPLTEKEAPYDYAMMILRTSEGLDDGIFRKKFGYSFYETRREKLQPYLSGGFLSFRDGKLFFTPKGFYLSNRILAEIL